MARSAARKPGPHGPAISDLARPLSQMTSLSRRDTLVLLHSMLALVEELRMRLDTLTDNLRAQVAAIDNAEDRRWMDETIEEFRPRVFDS
jgi:hypothetical protein